MRSFALLAVMAGLAAGCSLGSSGSHTPAPPGILAPPLSHYRANGISFSYPAAWSHHRHGFYTMETHGIIDLSTQPMVNPCRPAGNGRTCGWPLHALRRGGVVVRWTTGGDIDPESLPPPGTSVKVTRPGYCRSLGGDETVLARIITPRRSVFSVDACLRAPGVAAHERALRVMLASARAVSPPVTLATFHGGGVSFSYPAAWSHRRHGYLSLESDGIVDLSTQRMVNPCRHHGNITSCNLPIDQLRRDGVVVTWTIDGLPRAPSDVARPGVHVTVSRPGYCQTVGGDESLLGRLVTRKHEMLWMNACLRGPDLAPNERAVRAMLASAR